MKVSKIIIITIIIHNSAYTSSNSKLLLLQDITIYSNAMQFKTVQLFLFNVLVYLTELQSQHVHLYPTWHAYIYLLL